MCIHVFSICVGICVGNPIRLVMELAPHGPLNKFLRKNLLVLVGGVLWACHSLCCRYFSPMKIMNMVVQIAQVGRRLM